MSGDAVSGPLEQSKKPSGDGPTGVSSAVIPNKSLAESNKSDSPVPSYSGGRLLLIAFGAA